MPSLVGVVSLPVRLTVRALDDLHTLAHGVRSWSEHEAEVRAAARVADARTAALLEVERTLVEHMSIVVDKTLVLDRKLPDAAQVVAIVEDIRGALTTLASTTRTLDRNLPSTRQVLDAVDEVRASLTTLARTAEMVDADLPSAERIVEAVGEVRESLETVADTAAPLKPAARTLGRVAERLPGNRDRA